MLLNILKGDAFIYLPLNQALPYCSIFVFIDFFFSLTDTSVQSLAILFCSFLVEMAFAQLENRHFLAELLITLIPQGLADWLSEDSSCLAAVMCLS